MNLPNVSTIFWSVFALYSVGLVAMLGVLGVALARGSKAAQGGLVGAWLIVFPVVGMALLAALFLLTGSTTLRVIYTVVLAFPLLGILNMAINWIARCKINRTGRVDK